MWPYIYVYIWSKVIEDTQSAQISQKQDERNIYVYEIMKRMWPPGYHQNGFCGNSYTWAHDGHISRTSCTLVHELPQSHCSDDWEGILFSWSYIYIYIYIYIFVCVYKYNYFIKSVDAKNRYIKGKRKISLFLSLSIAWLLLGIF